jgi:hypothetical protein
MQQKSFINISHGWLVGKVPDLGSGGRGINPQVTLAQKTFLQLPGDQAARKILLSLYTKITLFSHGNHTRCKKAKNVIYFSM